MLSSEAANIIQAQVDDMQALCPASVDVKAIMSSFADRIMDPILQEVPPNVQETGCQDFADQYYATLPFDESCLPPVTSWYPLLPEQRLPSGFNPQFQDDLYHHLPSVTLQNEAWFTEELANINHMAKYPDAPRRLYSDKRVIPESLRVPNARGYIFDVLADKRVTLTKFHAPIQTQFNRTFIASIAGITALPDNPGASLGVQAPKFHDLEMLSDVILGCRLKAPVHTHSVYQRNMLSLAKNVSGIEKQAIQKQQRGIAEVHQHTTYSPCRYVSCGSVERKENPGNPRNTDNHSDPLEAFQDADGVAVESLNTANHRVSQLKEPAVPAGSLAPERHQQQPFTVDPDEQKCTIPQIVSDAMVLKHVADRTGREVFIAKFDMAFFFDQFVLAIQERWKNFRFLRVVPELVELSKLPKHAWKGMHQAHQRLGFGGRRNSKIAQRFAHLFVWVVDLYMARLELPYIEAATGYEKQWLQLRRCMNTEYKTNQARRHALHMYTDDLISLSLTEEASRNLVVAVFLAAHNMGVVLADVYKLEMGVAIKALGIHVFVAFAIIVIPTDKRLDGAERLQLVAHGHSTYEAYERLLGLLVHCLMMVYMDDTLLESMWKPLAFMRHRRQGKQETLNPKFHEHLHSVWKQWKHVLLTRPAARFTAALGDVRHEVRNVPTVHMYGDAFRSSSPTDPADFTAGIGGFCEGDWYHYAVPSADASVLDITKLEALTFAVNMQMFGSRLPPQESGGQVALHGDGLASVLNLHKVKVNASSHKRSRLANQEMRVIMDLSLGLSQVQAHLGSLVVAHTYGLGNAGDAPSRNEADRVQALCQALGIRCRQIQPSMSVVALVKMAAERVRQLRKEEQALHKGNPSHNAKDGPPSHCYRSPPVTSKSEILSPCTVPMKAKRNLTFSSPTKLQCSVVQSCAVLTRSPSKSTLPAAVPSRGLTRSPVKQQLVPFRGRGIAKASWAPVAKSSTKASTRKQALLKVARQGKIDDLVQMALSAYPADSPYAIKPPDVAKFMTLITDTQELVDAGVPDNTGANEQSAVTRYWVPFCAQYGVPHVRPPYSDLSSNQRKFEDLLRAAAMPYIHYHMPGKKHKLALPSSVMSSLRNICRWIDRDNGEKNPLVKPLAVLKGMLTRYVIAYGPIRPDQSLAIPKPVFVALLALDEEKLGRMQYSKRSKQGVHFRAMLQTGAQSGLRLDECSVGRSRSWDKRKISRRSLRWRIKGQIVHSPSPAQLNALPEVDRDGACLLPGCSKCDPFGTKHGSKVIFLPFKPGHAFNAATALRDLELAEPIMELQLREQTPLFQLDSGEAFPASTVRSMLYYMFQVPSVRCLVPDHHTDASGKPRYTFHSLRRTFATCLARAGADRPRIQSMVRWLDEGSVDTYDKQSLNDQANYVEAAYTHSPDAVTPATMDVKIDNNDLYQAWCDECQVIIEPFSPDF
jgi:integrase